MLPEWLILAAYWSSMIQNKFLYRRSSFVKFKIVVWLDRKSQSPHYSFEPISCFTGILNTSVYSLTYTFFLLTNIN